MTESRETREGNVFYEHGRVCFPPGNRIIKLEKAKCGHSAMVTHFERNVAHIQEVITVSRYRGDIAGGQGLWGWYCNIMLLLRNSWWRHPSGFTGVGQINVLCSRDWPLRRRRSVCHEWQSGRTIPHRMHNLLQLWNVFESIATFTIVISVLLVGEKSFCVGASWASKLWFHEAESSPHKSLHISMLDFRRRSIVTSCSRISSDCQHKKDNRR
jgi:hypothetical protein